MAECGPSKSDAVGSNPIARSRNLFHIKWLRNKFDYISTTDLADYFPTQLILKPQIPKADPLREDTITPRVCLATTLAGAAGSLGLARHNKFYLGIYMPAKLVEVYTPSFVHDAEKWGEVWSLRPVLAELQKIIIPGEMLC